MTVGEGRLTSREMTIDGDGHQNYVFTYDVFVTDAINDTEDQVSIATNIPLFGEVLSFNSNAICNGKHVGKVQEDASNLKRVVTATFTTKPGGRARSGNNLVQSPLDEPWKPSGSFATGTRITSRNKDGIPIVTTGLEVKEFEIPDGYDTLRLEGPSLTMSLSQRAQAVLRCNSATIWDLTARQVFLAQWSWEQLFHGDAQYFYHRLEFWIKYEKWNEFWINDGTQEYISGNPDGKRIVPILATNDVGGRQVRFLDIDGRIVTDSAVQSNISGGIPDPPVSGSLYPRESEIIPQFDFTALTASIGMPNPLPGNFV